MVKIKAIKDVKLPTKSNDLLNCYDLYIPEGVYKILQPQTYSTINLGVMLIADEPVIGELHLRYSATKKGIVIPNGVGIIIPSNTKELSIFIYNISAFPLHINAGDSICQLLVRDVNDVTVE